MRDSELIWQDELKRFAQELSSLLRFSLLLTRSTLFWCIFAAMSSNRSFSAFASLFDLIAWMRFWNGLVMVCGVLAAPNLDEPLWVLPFHPSFLWSLTLQLDGFCAPPFSFQSLSFPCSVEKQLWAVSNVSHSHEVHAAYRLPLPPQREHRKHSCWQWVDYQYALAIDQRAGRWKQTWK